MVQISEEYIKNTQKMSKEEIKMRLENNTLPKHMMEVFQEAKSWWFHCGADVLRDNYHTQKAAEEGGV